MSNEIQAINQSSRDLMSVEDMMKLSTMLSKASMVPPHFKADAGNVFVALQWGQEIGLKPMQALQNIMVIGGRPALWGDALIGLVRASSVFESIEETFTQTEAKCTVKRKGEKPVTRTFSISDAQRAGLDKKPGPWKDYPQRMLQMRARAFALRDVFPDVLKGMYVAEEVMDFQPADVIEIDTSIARQYIEQVKHFDNEPDLMTYYHEGIAAIAAVKDKQGYENFKQTVIEKRLSLLKQKELEESKTLVADLNEPIDIGNAPEVEREPGQDEQEQDDFLVGLDKGMVKK